MGRSGDVTFTLDVIKAPDCQIGIFTLLARGQWGHATLATLVTLATLAFMSECKSYRWRRCLARGEEILAQKSR